MSKIPKVLNIGAKLVVVQLRRLGLDVEKIIKQSGLEMRNVNQEDGWIPWEKYAALLEIAAQKSGDDYFGLHMAAREDLRDLGAIAYVGLSSRTYGDCLLNLERYLATVSEGVRIELSFDDKNVRVRFVPADQSFVSYRQTMELQAGLLVKGYQFFTKSDIAPTEVWFSHPFEGDTKEHKKIFACRPKFGQDRNQVVLARSILALPIETADDRLLKILITYCEECLKRRARNRPKELTQVERCIVDLLPRGQAKAKVVASEMGMSERSLVRRLAEAGTSFSEILNNLRRDLALKYLQEPQLSLTQIAFLLGYANPSAFSAAFKRMTGRSPKEMRFSNHS